MSALSEREWVLAGLRMLGEGGFRSVKVEVLARQLGVTKGSFYHHFSRRQDLLDAMLTAWIDIGTERVIVSTDAASDDPAERLLQLSLTVFAQTGDYNDVDAAIRDWAAVDAKVSVAVAAVDAQRISYVEALICESGVPSEIAAVRAELMYKALIGEFTWRRYGGPRLSAFALRDMVSLLLREHRTWVTPEMPPMPADLCVYKCTPEFTETTIPKGLLANHQTKAGTWGRIVVLSGRLRYQLEDGPCWVLEPGEPGVVLPQVLHRVEAMGVVCFRVDFYRR